MSNKEDISEIIESAVEDGRSVLTEYESKQILSNWKINVAQTRLANDNLEAVDAARELKYPVVMKVSSIGIEDRSEADCIRVGLSSEIEVRQAFDDIISNAKVYKEDVDIQGVLIQEYVPESREVVMGVIQDQSFGPTVKFGLGGIWLEVLKDISYKLAPISEEDAEEMIKEIDGYPVLSGLRGEDPIDMESLIDTMKKMSELPIEFGLLSEIDLNPVFVSSDGATVVDARMTLLDAY